MKSGDKVLFLSLNFTTDIAAPAKVWLEGTVVAVRRGRVAVETINGRSQIKVGSTCLRAA